MLSSGTVTTASVARRPRGTNPLPATPPPAVPPPAPCSSWPSPSVASCGGDPSASVLAQAGQALAAAGVRRILIVGGTERKERELRQKSPPDLDWRFIDGKRVQDDRYYQPHRDWAQVIIIWQSTPLDHKVSEHFDGKGDPRVITVRRRGVIAVAQELISHVSRP